MIGDPGGERRLAPDRTDAGGLVASSGVFIIGCHRSGTTLLRFLLDAHESLACPPESKFISALQQFVDYPQVVPALMSLGFSEEHVYDELRRLITRFLGTYAAQRGKRRWVDKTPNYCRHLDFIDRVFAGRVSFVVVVRHPLDCVGSLDEYARLPLISVHEDPDLAGNIAAYGRGRYAWARYWREIYERIHVFTTARRTRCCCVQYEQLVRSPATVLRTILSFLGEEYHDHLVERAFTTKHDRGYQDHKILRTKGIVEDSIDRWVNWDRHEIDALWEVVRPIAERFGYDCDSRRETQTSVQAAPSRI